MHPRNPYKTALDFFSLAEAYPGLKLHLQGTRHTIDFKNDGAQRRLTEAILWRDFHVRLKIPENRLCPPVPNRMNYVLWIQDIVYAHRALLLDPPRKVKGLDIGTGATAIYPILACKSASSSGYEWEMVSTEIDDDSFACAQTNILTNAMGSQIHILKASQTSAILFPLEDVDYLLQPPFDFSMCNPPFYASAQDIAESSSAKGAPPNAICTGAETEMIYEQGGEEGFVGRMVDESVRFGTRCRWYTSMLGKMSSVKTIVDKFRKLLISNYAITEFIQGQTRRWAVGWSFGDMHLPDSAARISSLARTHPIFTLLPPRNTLLQTFDLDHTSSEEVAQVLLRVLHEVDGVSFRHTSDLGSLEDYGDGDEGEERPLVVLLLEALGNTWSRGARRKKTAATQSGIGRGISRDVMGGGRETNESLGLGPHRHKGKQRHGMGVGCLGMPQNPVEDPIVNAPPSATSSTSTTSTTDTSKPTLTCTISVLLSPQTQSLSHPHTDGLSSVDSSPLPFPTSAPTAPDVTSDGIFKDAPSVEHGGRAGPREDRCVALEFQWVYGVDRVLFEGFVSHIGRKVRDRVQP